MTNEEITGYQLTKLENRVVGGLPCSLNSIVFEQVGLHNPCLGSKNSGAILAAKAAAPKRVPGSLAIQSVLWMVSCLGLFTLYRFGCWYCSSAKKTNLLGQSRFFFIYRHSSLEGPSGFLSNKWPKMWRATNVVEK